MTHPGGEITRRRSSQSSSVGGSAASVREDHETSRFHRPHPRDGSKTMGDRVDTVLFVIERVASDAAK